MNTHITPQQHTTEEDASPRPALKRLQKQVHRAAQEINRLRTENRRLKQRVQKLEQRPAVDENEAFVTLDDPEALRTQIEGFIDTIDAYLGDDPASNDASAQ
jgi:regulator of replication initiation timing